jgi:hypothetical protein
MLVQNNDAVIISLQCTCGYILFHFIIFSEGGKRYKKTRESSHAGLSRFDNNGGTTFFDDCVFFHQSYILTCVLSQQQHDDQQSPC